MTIQHIHFNINQTPGICNGGAHLASQGRQPATNYGIFPILRRQKDLGWNHIRRIKEENEEKKICW